MSRSGVIRIVAGREVRERIRSKAFRISTGVTLLFILAVAILPGLLSHDGPTTYDIGVFGDRADQVAARLPLVAREGDNLAVRVSRPADAGEGERLVKSGALDAAVGGGQVIVHKKLGDRLGFLIQESNRQVVGESTLSGAGVGGDVARRVLSAQPLEVR